MARMVTNLLRGAQAHGHDGSMSLSWLCHGDPGPGRIPGEVSKLGSQRPLERWPRLAPLAVSPEHRHVRGQLRVIHDVRHGRHERVASGEAILAVLPSFHPAG